MLLINRYTSHAPLPIISARIAAAIHSANIIRDWKHRDPADCKASYINNSTTASPYI